MPSTARRHARRPAATRHPKKKKHAKEDERDEPQAEEASEPHMEQETRPDDVPLPTQQIRHAMAEIRAAFAEKTALILSRQLETVDMTVSDFCFRVVLQMHKKRRVGSN